MIGFCFTTDGGDREDGNVYYSSYLIVNTDDNNRQAVADIIAQECNGTVEYDDFINRYDVMYDRYDDNDDENPIDVYETSWDGLPYSDRMAKKAAGEKPLVLKSGRDQLLAAIRVAGYDAEFVDMDFVVGQ